VIFGRMHMPALDGATGWLNADPSGPGDLSGRVVAVDFWTFTCINWLRTAPYVRAWAERYRDDGLVVIGVHTPEFSFEHEVSRVAAATAQRQIEYPVAIDNDYAVWTAYGNNVWPALYTIDAGGVVQDYHPGEGRYHHPERVIQRLLGIDREPVEVAGTGVEAAADWESLASPETYLGALRGARFASPGGFRANRGRTYEPAGRLRRNHWGLAGDWSIDQECVVLLGSSGTIAFRFHARDAHVVLSRRSAAPIEFRVLLDGEAPGASHGFDIDARGNGVLEASGLYNLVRQDGGVRTRTVEVTFHGPGAEAYVFTFG
jgi:thiol-disulfide isomerase/thioredoxin